MVQSEMISPEFGFFLKACITRVKHRCRI